MSTAPDSLTSLSADETAIVVAMPRLASAPAGAALVRWLVRPGQCISEGDVLAEVAAGNTTLEIEAPTSGNVAALLLPAGAEAIEPGRSIAVIAKAQNVATERAQDLMPPAIVAAVPETQASSIDPEHPVPVEEENFLHALHEALAGEMRRDPEVFLIGESVADFGRCSGVARGLLEEFGARRVVGTPITPAGFAGLAIGAAMAGLKPVVEFAGWALALQAIDQIVSTAAKTRYRSGGTLGVPIVFRALNGAWPATGPMHNVDLASWLAHVPGLKVVCPTTPACAKGLLRAAIRDPDPVIVLETEAFYDNSGPVPAGDAWIVSIGEARIARAGHDLSIVTYGRGVAVALAAAEQLAASSIEAEVVDLRSLRPLDVPAILKSVRKTGRLLAVDDGWPVASIGAEICATVASGAFSALRAPPARIASVDVPMPYAANLEQLVLPDASEVAAKALRLLASDAV